VEDLGFNSSWIRKKRGGRNGKEGMI